MRKEAGLQKADQVEVGIESADGANSVLCKVTASQAAYIQGRIGRPVVPVAQLPKHAVSLLTKQEEVRVQKLGEDGKVDGDAKEVVTISLCRGCAFFSEQKMAAAVPDAVVRDGAQFFVQSLDMEALKKRMAAGGGKIAFEVDKQKLSLAHGEHIFFGSAEALKAGAIELL